MWLGSSLLLIIKYKERNDLKVKLFSKKKADLKDLENSPPIHVIKSENAWWEENTKGMAEGPLIKIIMNQPS